ncbi:MAG: hypothetical protein ACI8W3_001154 [Myxococcota bacterium]|jgi:hypothetical protein
MVNMCSVRSDCAFVLGAFCFAGNSGVAIDMQAYSKMKRANTQGIPGERGGARQAMFRLFFSVVAAAVCSMSTVANATEVVEMRIGQHPTYTRVVFELNSPAGYSLEQNVLEDGTTELVVTLDASASDQKKVLSQALIDGVELSGQGKRSVAHIRLKDAGLRVKEMILGSPPRIVLDVLAPKSGQVAATKAPAKTPAASQPVKAAMVAPAAKMPITQPARTKEPAPVASISHGAPPSPTRVATRPIAIAASRPDSQPKAAPPVAPMAKPQPAAKPASVAKTPPPPARRKPATVPATMPAAPAAIPAPQSNSLFSATNVGGGLALLGLVGGGTFFMLRRRGGEEAIEEEGDEDPLSADNPFASLGDDFSVDAEPTPNAETAEVPFAGIADEPEANVVDEFAPDAEPIPEATFDDTEEVAETFSVDDEAEDDSDADIPVAKILSDSGPEEDLFDTSSPDMLLGDEQTEMIGAHSTEDAGENMESYTDSTMEPGMATVASTNSDDGSEALRMLREFEQRMAAMESRLDEVTEAKERLERQVAAQTEELRVQRAAIARTQRALRNLSRPGDESPTEPALRDPNT